MTPTQSPRPQNTPTHTVEKCAGLYVYQPIKAKP